MQTPVKLDGAACRIAENGNISLSPNSHDGVYLLFIAAATVGARMWVRELWIITTALLILIAAVVLIRWANQPKVQITVDSGMIEWRRWLQRRRFSFVDISRINVFFDQQVYDMLGHLVVRRKTVERHAQLELALKDGRSLFLGRLSGKHVDDHALFLAQTMARVMGVPVYCAGCEIKSG